MSLTHGRTAQGESGAHQPVKPIVVFASVHGHAQTPVLIGSTPAPGPRRPS